MSFASKTREVRLKEHTLETEILSDRAYNGLMSGLVVYGILVAYLMSKYLYIDVSINLWLFFLGFFGISFGGVILTNRAESFALRFVGYNMVVLSFGFSVSATVQAYGGVYAKPIVEAFGYTLIICVAMCAISVIFPDFFVGMGRVLFINLIVLLVMLLIRLVFPTQLWFVSYLGAALFSFYIAHDFARSQMFSKTANHAIACALDIYMDLINLFLYLVEIFGRRN